MVRTIRESEKAARRSAQFVAAIVIASPIVLVSGMKAQTGGAVAPAGPMAPALVGKAAPTQWVSSGATAQQLVDRVARDGWDTFSTRIAMRRQMVAADGATVGPVPTATEYIWERTRTARGWKTTMTMVAAPRVRVHAPAGLLTLPEVPTVVKTEDLGDGSAPRFWDLKGVEIEMPSPAVQAQVMGQEATAVGASMAEGILAGAAGGRAVPAGAPADWIDAIIMPGAKRRQRLSALERQFGRRRGVIRGLSRHLRQQVDGECELLVDEELGVPVEANLVAKGELVAHSTYAYERAASGALLRRGVRTERTVSGIGGARVVTEVSFSDIRVEQRGAPR